MALKDIFEHKCELEEHENILFIKYPGDSRKQKFYRRLRDYFTLSFENPRARRMFKSTHSMDKELTRHVKNHPNIIHPFSTFRYHWETFMIIVYLYAMLVIPLSVVHQFTAENTTDRENVIYVQLDVFHYFFCVVDIFINFTTGYVDYKHKEVVLVPWKIVVHYLITYFFFDFISSFPVDYILPMFLIECDNCDWFSIARLFKYVRLYSVELYFFRFCEIINMSYIMSEVIWCTVRFFFFTYLLCYVQYIVAWVQIGSASDSWIQVLQSQDDVFRYSYYRAACIMFATGYQWLYPESMPDQIFTIAASVLGCFFVYIFIGKILQWVTIINASGSKYDEMLENLKEYMRFKQLPNPLQERLIDYYEFRYQRHFFKETEILNLLSTQLRQEIILHTCRRLVENVSFFNNLPAGLLLRIVVCLRAEVFLANDVIVKAGAVGNCMFFITSGTVAVYTTTGKEVCHLEDGAHFGEIALVKSGQHRVASVVAIECCEMYRLDQRDFVRAISPFPDLVTRIERVAEERYERTTRLDEKNRRAIRLAQNHRRRQQQQERASAVARASVVGGLPPTHVGRYNVIRPSISRASISRASISRPSISRASRLSIVSQLR